MTKAGQYSVAGFQFTAAVLSGVFGGIWLDEKLGTTPWMVVVLVFLGAGIGFYSLYRNLMKGQRLGDRRQPGERREDPR